jgi:hypothetical protein
VVQGYVVDEKARDIILFGASDPARPALRTEDLVVALRNARMKYAKVEGTTRWYSPPGCSIDPDPQVLWKLSQIASQIAASGTSASVETGIEAWRSTSRSPQTVRVMGIPHNSHFARVMVDADYYMKRLVDGSEPLGLSGFSSLVDMALSNAKQDIEQGLPISTPLLSMNRFWFYPGPNRYAEDRGIVLIEECPVILLTEEEHLARSGITGAGRPSPLAQRFADSFSADYAQIASRRPVYSELEGLFRFVALAKILEAKNPASDLAYLLDGFTVPRVAVETALPGISNVKRYEHRRDVPGGYEIACLWLPSCGGVSIELDITSANFATAAGGRLESLRTSVLAARPLKTALSWELDIVGWVP